MKQGFKLLRDCVFHNPLALSSLPANLQRIASTYLPYSVGIEIECSPKRGHEYSEPDMLDYNLLAACSGISEQRFRIRNGVEGMISLYKVCEFMKDNYLLNNGSGIHYHIDCTKDYTTVFRRLLYSERETEYAMKQLDQWDYKGHYNIRGVAETKTHWIAMRGGFRTAEFRIGEMSFDYDVLIKRAIHASSIISKVINNQIK